MFRCCANTFLLLCRSNNRGLVINSSYNPFILFIFCPFFITFHIHFGIPHLTILHFSRCQCGHTIDDLGIHLLCCPCGSECITTHDMFRDTIAAIILESGIHVQRNISHLFPHHTQRRVDIVIIRKNFYTLADVVIIDPTCTNLV